MRIADLHAIVEQVIDEALQPLVGCGAGMAPRVVPGLLAQLQGFEGSLADRGGHGVAVCI
ncbi:MAG: hypothetical protein FJ100_22670 [Deltaproteobacteria bacterium]|nr:hypothetical protein [Deltaproteobacteria bacterium]